MAFFKIFAATSASAMMLAIACSDTNFSGQSARPSGNAETGQNILANFLFSDGNKKLTISAVLKPKSSIKNYEDNFSMDYVLVPSSIKSESSGDFPDDLAKQLGAAGIVANLNHDKNKTDNPFSLKIKMAAKGLVLDGKKIPDQNLELSQANSDASWTKSEGTLPAFNTSSTQDNSANCKIEPSGEQPRTGVYFVVLTKPAPCDFKLSKVMVQGMHPVVLSDQIAINYYPPTDVAIGTYWTTSPAVKIAHNFPLVEVGPKTKDGPPVRLDNGFILVQPDHNSYLLADGGSAVPTHKSFKPAQTIANDISQTLSYGGTTLLQPSAGQASDNFASATLFKKGSVIAIYDDTPDMAGNIDVNALVVAMQSTGFSLSWDAKLVSAPDGAKK